MSTMPTTTWEVRKGGTCPTCRQHVTDAIGVRLGPDGFHQLGLDTALNLGRTLVNYAENLKAKGTEAER